MSKENQSLKPGEGALIAMKNLNTDVVFKIPTVPAKRRKIRQVKVLDEDTYIEELGKIIQRDFFPDLEKLKAQNAYLEASERNDISKMRELYEKYSSGKRPRTERVASPATFETPKIPGTPQTEGCSETEQIETEDLTSEKPEKKQSLDDYLSSHTSEDNMSFQEMMEAAEEKLRQKFARLYGVENNNDNFMNKMLTLPSFQEQHNERNEKKMIQTWTYKNKNYIMYVPDGVELTKDEKVEMAKQKQQISYSNTRLSENPFDESQSKETIHEIAKSQARIMDGRIGVDGNTVIQTSPSIRGYHFVRTPSPSPSTMGSPLMTWGEIEGSPFRLDGGDTPLLRSGAGPAFKIAETPKREKIAYALAEKAGERHRGLKQKAIEAAKRSMATPSPRPSSSLEVLANMSPAARRLVTGKLKGLSGNICTPSPQGRAPGSPFLTPRKKNLLTPKIITNSTQEQAASPLRRRTPKVISASGPIDGKNNLTDNLLNISVPKRKTAADFF